MVARCGQSECPPRDQPSPPTPGQITAAIAAAHRPPSAAAGGSHRASKHRLGFLRRRCNPFLTETQVTKCAPARTRPNGRTRRGTSGTSLRPTTCTCFDMSTILCAARRKCRWITPSLGKVSSTRQAHVTLTHSQVCGVGNGSRASEHRDHGRPTTTQRERANAKVIIMVVVEVVVVVGTSSW